MEIVLLGVKNENGKIIISPNRHGIQEPTGIIIIKSENL
jgi:hypothetical protein